MHKFGHENPDDDLRGSKWKQIFALNFNYNQTSWLFYGLSNRFRKFHPIFITFQPLKIDVTPFGIPCERLIRLCMDFFRKKVSLEKFVVQNMNIIIYYIKILWIGHKSRFSTNLALINRGAQNLIALTSTVLGDNQASDINV